MGIAPTSGDRVGEVLVRAPGDGPASWAMGSLFERLASSAETSGAFGLSLVTQPPGVATPLHVHTHEAEAFFLLDGTMSYQAGQHALSVERWLLHLPAKGRAARLPRHRKLTGPIPWSRRSGRTNGLVRRGRHAGHRTQATRTRRAPGRGGDTAVERSEPPLRAARCRATHSERDLTAPHQTEA
jgi:hypothetical protein